MFVHIQTPSQAVKAKRPDRKSFGTVAATCHCEGAHAMTPQMRAAQAALKQASKQFLGTNKYGRVLELILRCISPVI